MARHHWGRLLLATVVPLVLVELLLQIAAFVVAARAPDPAAPMAGGSSILCVGDSYTFGYGATTPAASYPSRLEKHLADATAGGPTVVNLGWPGRNTREALVLLRSEIVRIRPAVVLLLIGINDAWTRPEPLAPEEAAEQAGRFVLRWRIWRLLELLLQPRATSPTTSPAAALPGVTGTGRHPLVGRWQDDRLTVVFKPDGTLLAGAVRWRWREEGGELRFIDDDGRTTLVPWRLDGEQLDLTPPPPLPPLVLRRVARSADTKEAVQEIAPDLSEDFLHTVRTSVAARDIAGAERAVEEWLAALPEDPRAHAEKVVLALRANRADVIGAELAWLRERRRRDDDEAANEACVVALHHAGELAEAVALGRLAVARFPENGTLWKTVARCAWFLQEPVLAEQAIDRVIELTPGAPAAARAEARLLRVGIVLDRDPAEAARELVRSWRIEPDPARTRLFVARQSRRITAPALERACDEVGLSTDLRAALLAAFAPPNAGVAAEADSVAAVHLEQMVEVCRRASARPFLLTYPFAVPAVDGPRQSVIARTGVEWIDVSQRFAVLLETLPREALFVPDGHCNDRGYDEMAVAIAAALRRQGIAR